ncbi:PH domain-like protein [Poronia punctata]|nr:PH domain-like protein [Poronia punctata]
MSRSTPRKNQDPHGQDHNHGQAHSQSNANNAQGPNSMYPHVHSPGHARTRSQQLQPEGQRRPRQTPYEHQPQGPVTSDYESDTMQYMASHPSMGPEALATRTNTDLNLAVLRRYLPSITSILSIAANAVVYTFHPPSEWKRATMEGTMFLCSQHKPRSSNDTSLAGCLFILNRKGLMNFVIELDTVSDFELSGDLLIFKLFHPVNTLQLETGEMVAPDVLGLWTYAEDKMDREMNATLIQDMWAQTRKARPQVSDLTSELQASVATAEVEAETAAQAVGRKVSLTELFSTYGGNSIPTMGP